MFVRIGVASVTLENAPVPPTLGLLERAVMEQVWDTGESTVRDVLLALNAAADRDRAYTTVMTIMRKLDRKGMLTRRREGKTDFYMAVIDREAYKQARARAEVSAVIREYGDLAYANFAREVTELDPARRAELRRLADS